jgi:hypothetical protein
MRQGSTVPINFLAEGVDLTSGYTVRLTFDKAGEQLHKTNEDFDSMTYTSEGTIITLSLTQAESLSLQTGRTLVEANIIDENGLRVPSDIVALNVQRNIYKEVMTYE